MTTGKISFFNYERLFGFIRIDDPPHEEFFFHLNECLYKDIQEGDRVSFHVEKSKNKAGKFCCCGVEKM